MSIKNRIVSFYLPEDLIEKINKAAKSVSLTKSQLVKWVLEENLDKVKIVAEAMDNMFSEGI